MKSNTRMIVLEFNELTPALMQRFMSEGKLPNFARLYEEGQIYTTTAEEKAPHLDPWIQWVTVHSGLNFRDHGLERLNEGHTLKTPRVWDLLAGTGRRSWICGSMNIAAARGPEVSVLPDPWTTSLQPSPAAGKPDEPGTRRRTRRSRCGKRSGCSATPTTRAKLRLAGSSRAIRP